MKKHACLLVLFLMAAPGFTQELNYINELSEKKATTFEDAVKMFIYTLGKTPAGFDADVNTLKGARILKGDTYNKEAPLRRGMLALMAARQLKLTGSFLFLIFDTERYAHRACVAADLMDVNSSEWDPLTGDELLGIMGLVEERMEGAK